MADIEQKGKQLFFTRLETALEKSDLTHEQLVLLAYMAGAKVSEDETEAQLKQKILKRAEVMSKSWVPEVVTGSAMLIASWYFVTFLSRLIEGDIAKLDIPYISRGARTWSDINTLIGLNRKTAPLYYVATVIRFALAFFGSLLLLKAAISKYYPRDKVRAKLLKYINMAQDMTSVKNPHPHCAEMGKFLCGLGLSPTCELSIRRWKCVPRTSKRKLYKFTRAGKLLSGKRKI